MNEEAAGAKPAISTEAAQGLAIVLAELGQAKSALINSTLDEAPQRALEYMAVRERSTAAIEAVGRDYDLYKAENPGFDPTGCGPAPDQPMGGPGGATASKGAQSGQQPGDSSVAPGEVTEEPPVAGEEEGGRKAPPAASSRQD